MYKHIDLNIVFVVQYPTASNEAFAV